MCPGGVKKKNLQTISHLGHLSPRSLPPHPASNLQRRRHGTPGRQNGQGPAHGAEARRLHHEAAPDGPDEHPARKGHVEEPVRGRVGAAVAEDARVEDLLDVDDVRDLGEQGRHGQREGDAEAGEQARQERDLGLARVGDGADGDEEGDGEEEAEGGGDAGTALVGPVAHQGRGEGGENEREEDEAAAGGGPAEEGVHVQRQDGVPGCEEGGVDEGAEEGGDEPAGTEEAEDGRGGAFAGGDGGG